MKYLFLLIFIISIVSANDSALIYGKIVLKNGEEINGTIRWGKKYGKEHFWFDSFNSSKLENEYEDLVDRKEFREKNRKRGIFATIERVFNKNRITTHTFECHFGDIKRIKFRRRSKADVYFKNDDFYEVKGTDSGKDIYIMDEETGDVIKYEWSRIDYIDFMETPTDLKFSFGKGLYGKVETELGTYEGYIQWDYDESLLEDELDGAKSSYTFSDIKRITKENRRSVLVLTNDDREYILKGTNDVNDGNRGIAIKNHEVGLIEVEWNDFIAFDLIEPKEGTGKYSDFKNIEKISAEVSTKDGEVITGNIAFDLDESYNIEVLNGKNGNMKFSIPFRLIDKITPNGRHSSDIVLKSGRKIELSDSQDVDDNNDGLLIWKSADEKPLYKKWRNIKSIKIL